MPTGRAGRWPGGYIRKDAKGRETYYVKREVAGQVYEVSTRAHGLRAAMAQLERFEADPRAYSPAGAEAGEQLNLDEVLIEKFLAWSESKGNTAKHRRDQKRYLKWWALQLLGVDLRQLDLRAHVLPALDKIEGARGLRIAALKTTMGWLFRERYELQIDPLAALKVPQAKPERRRRRKARTKVEIDQVRARLPEHWRPAFDLQLGTGWHVTEVERWAHAGEEESATDEHRRLGAVAVLLVKHKRGDTARTPVTQEALEAARELRKRGGISISRYAKAVREASAATGERWGPGQLRHSVLTNARRSGATLQQTAEFAHHSDPRTTARFYADEAPGKVPTFK